MAETSVVDIFLPERCEVLTHLIELVQVETCIVFRPLQGGYEGFRRHMGRSHGERRNDCIDDIRAGFHALQDGHGGESRCVVGMDIDRDADCLLEFLYEVIAGVRSEQSGHVLDAQRIRAHVLKFLRILSEVIIVVHGADGVGDGSLYMRAFLLGRVD